jgi:hypothetical protein
VKKNLRIICLLIQATVLLNHTSGYDIVSLVISSEANEIIKTNMA